LMKFSYVYFSQSGVRSGEIPQHLFKDYNILIVPYNDLTLFYHLINIHTENGKGFFRVVILLKIILHTIY
jgi:hypothetical protein